MRGIGASFYREYRLRTSSPRVLVENILNPLFILAIFGYAWNSSIVQMGDLTTGKFSYIHFFLMGVINISFIASALLVATNMFVDRYYGLYEEMLTYPVSRISILLGKLGFNLIISLVQAFAMMFFVWIVEGSIYVPIHSLLKLFLIFCLGSSTWFFGAMILAVKIKSHDMFNTVYFLIVTPITFTSSIYYPIESLPTILRPVGLLNPLSWFTDICREFYLGTPTDYLIVKIVALFVLFVILAYFATQNYKK